MAGEVANYPVVGPTRDPVSVAVRPASMSTSVENVSLAERIYNSVRATVRVAGGVIDEIPQPFKDALIARALGGTPATHSPQINPEGSGSPKTREITQASAPRAPALGLTDLLVYGAIGWAVYRLVLR